MRTARSVNVGRSGASVTRTPARALQRRAVVVRAQQRPVSPAGAIETPHIQLATAKLPTDADEVRFQTSLYQHFATLTQSGANLPFVLPLRVDRLSDGNFRIALLRRGGAGDMGAAAELVSSIESIDQVGRVLFLRLYEGPNAFAGREFKGKQEDRLEAIIQAHPDIDTLMTTFVPAVRKAAAISLGRVAV